MFVLRSYISEETATQQIKDFLTFIMRNHFILQYNTPLEFDILTLSLRSMDDWKPSLSLYEFLDNCILRLVRDPVHYCGELEVSATPTDEAQLSLGKKKKGSSNLLMIAIRKQWSFFVSANSKRDVLNATSWLDRYFDICARVGEDVSHLSSIRDHLAGQTADEKCRIALQKTFSKPPLMDMASSLKFLSGEKAKLTLDEKLDPVIDEDPISLMRKVLEVELKPPAEPEDYPVLGWWTKKDIPDVLEDGDIGKLLFCLCSEHGEIRRQGMINLHVLMSKLEVSDVPPPSSVSDAS
jgi:nucleolar pre-ribosomal-associated protein 1